MPESQLIVAPMLDLQNLRELGKGVGRGGGGRELKYARSPVVALSILPEQSSSAFKIQGGS